MLKKLLILLTGVFCASTSVIMIKASSSPPEFLCSYRLLIAASLLSPFYIYQCKKHKNYPVSKSLRRSFFPGMLLGLHLITWTIGARLTLATNSSLVVNLIPVAMPLFAYVLLKERLKGRELLGTLVALTGVLILTFKDYTLNEQYLRGDIICFFSMLLFALYLIFARRNKDVPALLLYLTPLYAIAGLTCLLFGLARHGFPVSYAPKEWLMILLLAIFPTISGHSLLNYSMKHLRSQIVAIINLFQFIFAGLLGFYFFQEVPYSLFYLSSFLVLAGALYAIKSHKLS